MSYFDTTFALRVPFWRHTEGGKTCFIDDLQFVLKINQSRAGHV